ncbi:MAG TPA: acyl--CoA ligase family protein [Thermomicrobiales bacterium]|nr:acyl--CoA ligase family protein [Thermomicrobiales bacterium]
MPDEDAGAVYRAELTPLSFLQRSAAVYRERVAVIDGERRLTYAELGERAARLAGALRAAGVRPGDRVAFLAPNSPALLEAHYGVPLAGAVLVALNTRLAPGEVATILRHSGARLLVVDDELRALAAGAPETVETTVTIGGAGNGYEAWLASATPYAPAGPVPSHEEDLLALDYTSGTTGQPKGVMYSHRGAYLTALAMALECGLSPASVYLWTLPMFHCNGWCFPWAVTAAGATHVCLRRPDPDAAWAAIARHGVTHLCAAPTVLIGLAERAPAGRDRAARPVRAATGGAPPSPTLLARLEEVGVEVTHLYGLTETYGPSAVCAWHPEWDARPAGERAALKARQGVGNVCAGPMRVVDPEGRDVPADGATMGEVVLRGNTVMRGYYRQPEATADAFRHDWFHTGDLGVMHPDGYIELRDRAKDIIISGGENIATIEVEQVLARHPAVLEAAVVATPDERWGERPKAFVTLRPGGSATAGELIAFCRDRLAHFKCPDAVVFGDLPKTSTGKIQKNVLRAREWAGRERGIN